MRIGIILLLFVVPAVWAEDPGAVGRGPLQLTLKRAVDVAISPEGSAQIQLAGEA